MQTVAGSVWLPSSISLLPTQGPSIKRNKRGREDSRSGRSMLGENGKSWKIGRQESNGRRMREGDRREATEMRKIGWERKYKTKWSCDKGR
jgi:hypothetical protein